MIIYGNIFIPILDDMTKFSINIDGSLRMNISTTRCATNYYITATTNTILYISREWDSRNFTHIGVNNNNIGTREWLHKYNIITIDNNNNGF